MPTGANSNMSIGAKPAVVIKPLTTRLLEVLIKLTELDKMEQNASGRSSLLGEILARSATPIMIGMKNAVQAVLLMKELRTAEAIMTTASSQRGRLPV